MTELEVLEQVASVSGKNDKLQILKDNSNNKELAELLDAVFNYNRVFHIKKFDMPQSNSINCSNMHQSFIDMLNKLENKEITGNAAKDAVESWFGRCTEQEQTWYAKVLRKDLKAGFSAKTAVKAGFKNIPLFDVMLAKDGKECKKLHEIVSQGVYVTPKYDGYRCLAVVNNGTVTLFSRNGTVYNNFPTVAEDLIDRFPTGSHVFDGEIMSDDFQAMQKSAFANKRGTTVGDVKFHIFGYVPYDEWASQNFELKTSERLEILYGLEEKLTGGSLALVKHQFVNSVDKILELERQYLAQGYEGAMALPDIPYYIGKKTNKLLKFKTMQSQDCEIIGFYEGTAGTRNEGRLGGFLLRQENGLECECGTGFSDDDRDYIWANQSEFLGKTAEVKYQEMTNHDIMRFPVFMRYRNDK